ncbi:MAG: NAD(P)/FAD-dependent oxidoreductase [Fastidiosipilaceae bacterium]
MTRIVIIGSSAAGISAAEAARKQDPNAEIRVFSQDTFLPYYRLRIGEVITDPAKRDSLTLHPASWYEDRRIELNLNQTVTGVDVKNKTIALADESAVEYDKLILAQGSHSFVPPIPGADLDGVMTLWSMTDALTIESKLTKGKSCVIIGGGLLGLETAYQAALKGVDTTVVDTSPRLLARQLDDIGSEIFRKQVEKQGVNAVIGGKISAIIKNDSDGKALAVELEDGTLLPANLVIISTGVRPNVAILDGTGIEIGHHVVCTNKMETNVKDVYAAGDVMEQGGAWFGQWSISMGQGKVAGTNAAGGDAVYELTPPPYTINTMDTKVAAGGKVSGDEEGYHEDVTRSDGELHYRKVCYLDGKVCGFVLIGNTKEYVKLAKEMKETD